MITEKQASIARYWALFPTPLIIPFAILCADPGFFLQDRGDATYMSQGKQVAHKLL